MAYFEEKSIKYLQSERRRICKISYKQFYEDHGVYPLFFWKFSKHSYTSLKYQILSRNIGVSTQQQALSNPTF